MKGRVAAIAASFLKARPLFNSLTVMEASKERVICHFKVKEEHLNINDTLFGGFTASLIDIGGSLGIAAKGNTENLGVSTDLSVTFIKAAQLNDIVVIDSSCLRLGKNMAFTSVKLLVDGEIIAVGSHSKFMNIVKKT